MKKLFLSFLLLMWSATISAQPTETPVILVVGDSLSANYGIAAEDGWVTLLQERLAERGYRHTVLNASVSGETTHGARARLPALLERHRPAIVVIPIGGNDGLRGLSLEAMAENLTAMIRQSREAGARALLLGVRLPPNLGPVYRERFTAVYQQVANHKAVPLVPLMLEGVDTDPELMQPDGIHPNAAAQPIILENVWPALERVLE